MKLKKVGKSQFAIDFKKFIKKGNVVDMAVGVIVGAAFSKIVSSLVSDIINPFIALIINQGSFESLIITLKEATEDTTAITVNVGVFLQTVLDFLIIAFCIFTVLRLYNRIKNALDGDDEREVVPAPAPAPAPPKPTNEEIMTSTLIEIKQLLDKANREDEKETKK